MIILDRLLINGAKQSRHVVALFGMGLIGRAIIASLKHLSEWSLRELPFSWSDASQRYRDSIRIEQLILKDLAATAEQGHGIDRIDIVWAAGRAGFASLEAEVRPELDAFKDVVELSERICRKAPEAKHAFHLLSSAGGLFEGQRQVNRDSIPDPQRSYGTLKLEQERHLAARSEKSCKLIYRPSSVYGFSGSGLRVGLVSALVQNAIRHRVSRIFGEPHTIRDYVLVSDIGSFVAERLTTPLMGSQLFLLASGKPSSMFEMMHKIEQAVGRRLYCQFDSQPSNASHISFCRGALPFGWSPTDLDTGIRQTALQLRTAFVRSEQ